MCLCVQERAERKSARLPPVFDMHGQRPFGNIERLGDVVKVHFIVFQQYVQDVQSGVRCQGIVDCVTFCQFSITLISCSYIDLDFS